MYRTARRISLITLTLVLAVGLGACKKKPKEKKDSADPMAKGPTAMDMDSMKSDMGMDMGARPVGMDTMAAKETPRPRPRPKKLSFEEQLKLSLPVTPKPAEQKVEKLTLKPELCKVEGTTFLNPSNMSVLRDVVAAGDKVYVLADKDVVLRFAVAAGKACKLTLDKAWAKEGIFKAPHRVSKLGVDKKGNLVLSSFMGVSRYDKTGKPLAKCKPGKNASIALHPSGKWGLGYFVSNKVTLAKFSAKACEGKPWDRQDPTDPKNKLGELKSVNTIGFYKNLILVGGVHKTKVKNSHPRVVVAYTKGGKKKFQFGALSGFKGDNFGWFHGIAQGKKAPICVLDSNFRSLSFWSNKGKFQGAVKLGKLFGVHYPWINSFSVTPKGTGWFVVGVSRKFKEKAPKGSRWSVGEGFLFRVTGL
jgi:hypothetical protein